MVLLLLWSIYRKIKHSLIMADLFREIIPAILQTKEPVLENEKDYVPFIVNKALSFHPDCVLFANQMNMNPNLSGKAQFSYLLNTIRPWKRPYQKWLKREKIETVEALQEYYGYSIEKARQAASVLTPDQIMEIKRRLEKGGLNDNNKATDRGISS